MRVFVDLHHGDLYFSLHRLFVERLGFELYRPIGLGWFNEGWWKIAAPYGNAQDTINQYLEINQSGFDAYKNLNGNHYFEDEVYHVYDPGHDYYQHAITIEKFRSMKFDLIVSTIPAHDISFAPLLQKYQPQAKHISQMGNVGQHSSVANIMTSVPYAPRAGQNVINYHQEIDPALYKYVPPDLNTRNVVSMVNCLPNAHVYRSYKNGMSDVTFKAHGASSPDGPLSGAREVAAGMQIANIGWHIKPQDGFGHTAMGWFASGRPVVTNMSDVVRYGADAPRLFDPGVTCINLEAGTFTENCTKIREWLEPENQIRYGENAYKRFCEVVNYDEEELQIKKFLERLI